MSLLCLSQVSDYLSCTFTVECNLSKKQKEMPEMRNSMKKMSNRKKSDSVNNPNCEGKIEQIIQPLCTCTCLLTRLGSRYTA